MFAVLQGVHETIGEPFAGKHLVFFDRFLATDELVAHLVELGHVDAHDLHVIIDVTATRAGSGRHVIREVHHRRHAGYAAHRAEGFHGLVVELGIAHLGQAAIVHRTGITVGVHGDDGQIAHRFEHLLVLLVNALAQRDHEHNRAAADDNAQHGQNRTGFTPP